MGKSGSVAALRLAPRPGEGTTIDVVRQTLPTTEGTTAVSVSLDLGQAPVPNRRYVSDEVGIVSTESDVRLLFGQRKISGTGLRALLVIHMTPESVRGFLQSIDVMQKPSIEDIMDTVGASKLPLSKIAEEPEQTVALIANMVAAAISGREACLDFYHASSFAILSLRNSPKKLAIDAVVRVDLSTGLFAAMIEKLRAIDAEFARARPGG